MEGIIFITQLMKIFANHFNKCSKKFLWTTAPSRHLAARLATFSDGHVVLLLLLQLQTRRDVTQVIKEKLARLAKCARDKKCVARKFEPKRNHPMHILTSFLVTAVLDEIRGFTWCVFRPRWKLILASSLVMGFVILDHKLETDFIG